MEEVPAYARTDLYKTNMALLRSYGYVVTDAVLNAADYGVAQSRRRHFTVAVRGSEGVELKGGENSRQSHRADVHQAQVGVRVQRRVRRRE
jgi:site-specific DNA-cytosine methylase